MILILICHCPFLCIIPHWLLPLLHLLAHTKKPQCSFDHALFFLIGFFATPMFPTQNPFTEFQLRQKVRSRSRSICTHHEGIDEEVFVLEGVVVDCGGSTWVQVGGNSACEQGWWMVGALMRFSEGMVGVSDDGKLSYSKSYSSFTLLGSVHLK